MVASRLISSLICLGSVVRLVGGQEDCIFTDCVNKLLSQVVTCPSGYSYSGTTQDCGDQTCLLSICKYANEKHMCCPDASSCAWYDASCNWNALTTYFVEGVTDKAREDWAALDSSVQSKLTSSEMFQTLTQTELQSLSVDLLSQVKSVTGMTAEQLVSLRGSVHDMDATNMRAFLANVNVSAFVQGLPQLTMTNETWTSAQASALVTRLQVEDAWGAVSTWSADDIDALGNLLPQVDLATLRSMDNSALASASSLSDLSSTQLKGLREKMQGMNTTEFRSIVDGVKQEALVAALEEWGADASWNAESAAIIKARLERAEVWGSAETWDASKVEQLGVLVADLDTATFTSLANRLSAEQLRALSSRFSNLTLADFTDAVASVNSTALQQAIAAWGSRETEWDFDKVSALSAVLQKSENWGSASQWNSERVSALDSMLVFMPSDVLSLISKESLANATNLRRLSAAQITTLWTKVADMEAEDFAKVIAEVDSQQLHASLLSECNLTCENELDAAFLRDPSMESASEVMTQYGQTVTDRGAMLALKSVESICDPSSTVIDSLNDLDSIMQSSECTGSASGDNTLHTSAESMTATQQSIVAQRLFASDAFGEGMQWNQAQLTSLCNSYAGLTPANIAQIAANAVVNQAAETAIDAALGPGSGQLVLWTLSKAAEQIPAEQKEAWADKLKESIGQTETWGCTQVASARELGAGLRPSDLATIGEGAMRGFIPAAISSMSSVQLSSFDPAQIVAMLNASRAMISGADFDGMSPAQVIAAVCGVASLSSDDVSCANNVIDVAMMLPTVEAPLMHGALNETMTQQIIRDFSTKLSVSQDMVKVLSVEVLPDGTKVTVRAFLDSALDTGVSGMQVMATSFSQSRGGSVFEEATGMALSSVVSGTSPTFIVSATSLPPSSPTQPAATTSVSTATDDTIVTTTTTAEEIQGVSGSHGAAWNMFLLTFLSHLFFV